MAKLYFRYGAMNSGKTTALLQCAHNYEERDQHVLIAKPGADTKGGELVVSRLGVQRPVDLVFAPETHVRSLVTAAVAEMDVACAAILVDEAQFLNAHQVDDLLRVAVLDDIPVLTWGIRTDFRTQAFPGSRRLLEVAHTLEELKTICRCGRKAVLNARMLNGKFIFEGDQIAIDGSDEVTYESMCVACYLQLSNGAL